MRIRLAAIAASLLLSLSAWPASAQTGVPTPLTRVFGIVFDSVAMRPLTGAVVQFVEAADPSRVRTATSDDKGTFAFDDVPRGAYLLGFFHPRLDSLSLNAPMLRVDVRAPGALRASLSIPSGNTIIASLCGPAALRDSVGLFQGRVRRASGEPLQGPAKVRVQWAEIVLGSRGIERKTPSVLATTTPEGAFAVCGVPVGTAVMTRAFSGSDSSGYVEFEVPMAGYLNRDIIVAQSSRVAPNDSLPLLTVSRGTGALRGVVRNIRGETVQGARVGVWSSGLEVQSNANGQFAMTALPGGTYTLETRAIGFQVVRKPVDIPVTGEGVVDVVLEPLAVLDTVQVRARAYASSAMMEFEARRKSGMGYFLDQEAVDKRQAMTMADLFRLVPGMTISPGQTFGDAVLMRGTGTQAYCTPTLFLNGTRVMTDDGNLDQLVDPREVRGVEVYSRLSNVPAQFQSLGGCGSIVVWTGARR